MSRPYHALGSSQSVEEMILPSLRQRVHPGGVKVPFAWTHGLLMPSGSSTGPWRRIQKLVEFFLGLFTFIAVAFLQLTDHFLRLALNLGYVVVG